MRHRPSDSAIGWWLVLGASIASIGTALTGFEHQNSVAFVGIGNPAIRALLIWIVAVAVQFVIWRAWTALRHLVREK